MSDREKENRSKKPIEDVRDSVDGVSKMKPEKSQKESEKKPEKKK